MTPPLILRPNCPQESVAANESTSTQLFRVMYITLTGLVDSMVPSNGPWAIIGKSLSYIVRFAHILWWALPSWPAGRLPASPQEPPTGWIPDAQDNHDICRIPNHNPEQNPITSSVWTNHQLPVHNLLLLN
ncbi:hypothetical protein DSO57_1032839 [Entomophthora muscae]|uniref:Uncharacterized protein n=1 Tax=Entomophthora muscae TaxID=34485 RepID=A0ACC2REX1_9FUNG|nr:hypothetical protein DSO57_1032839 [Entomophthora muscae]